MLVTALVLLSLVILTLVLTRLSLDVDPQTGERVLRKSSLLGRYYDFVTDLLWLERWENLTTCVIARRIFITTVLGGVVLLAGTIAAMLFIMGLFYVPYWLLTHGWTVPVMSSAGRWPTLFFTMGASFLVVIGFSGGFFLLVLVLDRLLYNVDHKESIVRAWWRAKKERVCHRVRVVD